MLVWTIIMPEKDLLMKSKIYGFLIDTIYK